VAVRMHARDGSWDIRLNESRINRMLSGDREQALYMGFWDKFGDFFRGIGGHKKAEVLEHVWDLLNTNQTTPENSVQTEGDKLKRSVHIFNKLRELADPAYQRVFNVRITGNTQNCPYLHVEFRIGDTLLKTQSVNDVANIECFLNNVDLRGAELSGVILNNFTLVNVNLEGSSAA
ncbi:pentapeptide repeat-containing protein, partial [Escherichia coli]|nr:pentapeptide repeat-containing protein [Escherichia coli]